jgi:hypothetical protein
MPSSTRDPGLAYNEFVVARNQVSAQQRDGVERAVFLIEPFTGEAVPKRVSRVWSEYDESEKAHNSVSPVITPPGG